MSVDANDRVFCGAPWCKLMGMDQRALAADSSARVQLTSADRVMVMNVPPFALDEGSGSPRGTAR